MKHPNVSKALEFSRRPLTVVLALGLAVRLVLMPLLQFELDLAYWLRITGLLDAGFTLYDTPGYYYTPIWGYVVAFFSTLGSLIGISDLGTFVPEITPYISGPYFLLEYVVSPAYAVMMKLPIIIADTVTAYLLYDLVKDITDDDRKAVLASALWYLCPFVILISSVHGMFDSISAMLILSTICFIRKRSYFLGGVSFSLAVLTKFFPIFLMFFLIAYVFRREGIDRNGVRHLLVAIAGALIALFVVQMPTMVKGQFWESLYFLTNRVGLSTDFMYSVTTPKLLAIYGIVSLVLITVMVWFHRTRYHVLKDRIIDMGYERRNRLVKITLFSSGIVCTLGVIAYTVISLMLLEDATLVDALGSLGMKGVMLLSLFTLILELYIAYRMLESETFDDRTVCTFLLLSSLAIFLWPPLPQYAVVIIPFIALYIATVDGGFRRPFRAYSAVLFIYELFVLNASVLFTLAVYTDLVPLDIPLAVTEVASMTVMGLPLSGIVLGVLVIFEYLAMLAMFKYLYDRWKVWSNEE